MMRLLAIVFAAACTAVPAVSAQQTAMSILDLKVITKADVPLAHRSYMTRGAICDGAGNVYVRRLQPDMKDYQERAALPIRKVTPAGNLAGNFRILDAFPNDITGRGVDVVGKGIFVTTDGRVFQTAQVHSDVFVVEFAQDGSVKTKTKLLTGSYMQPWHLGVFKSGEYLLTATTGEDNVIPFTAVFTADGRLLKKIYEPEDEEARQRSSPADWSGGVHVGHGGNGGTDFVSFGDVAAGSDGNMYLLHGTVSPALVYVISHVGDLVRKIRIDIGDSELVPRSIKSYNGRLAIQFDKWFDIDTHQNLIEVTDLQGNPTAEYRMGTVVGNHSLYLAGYGPEGFTFMPYENDGNLYLVKARLP